MLLSFFKSTVDLVLVVFAAAEVLAVVAMVAVH
jgi:hypothetical protein